MSNLKFEAAVANQCGAMEADTISKNGRNLKSQMSKRNFVVFVCLIFFGSFSTHAQESKHSIAVVNLQYDLPVYEESTIRFLTDELVNTKKYTIVERSKVEQAINELGLQDTQSASERNTHAAEIGNLLGVEKVITGKVSLSDKGRTVSLCLIDVESGTITTATKEQEWDKVKKKKGNVVRYFESDASTSKTIKSLVNELLN